MQNNVSFSALFEKIIGVQTLFFVYTRVRKGLLDLLSLKSQGVVPLVSVSIGFCYNLVLLLAYFAL